MINPMQLMMQLQKLQNPMGAIQQIFSQNPAYSKVMNLIQNKNPQEIEQIARNTFQTQGIDVNKFAKEKLGVDISNLHNNFPYKQN